MKRLILIAVASVALCGCSERKSTDAAMDRFIDDLMGKMTLEEKTRLTLGKSLIIRPY